MSQNISVYENGRKSPDKKLVELLKEHAGLNPEGKEREELLQLCRDNGFRVITKEEEAAESSKTTANEGKKPTGYVIELQGSKDRKQVPVGVNGVITLIKCDVQVRVKPPIYEVLKNAEEDFFEFDKNDSGKVLNVTKRKQKAIPFQLHEVCFD